MRSGGLVSGIDTNTLVKQLVALEKAPITKLERKKSGYNTQISSIGKIKSALSDLKAKAKALDTNTEFLTMKGASTEEAAFTVDAKGNAAAAKYSLEVTQVATSEKDRSVGYTSATAEVKAGTLDISVQGGAIQQITITQGSTLQDVAAKINDSVDGASASIISDGTNSYLSISADKTGFTVGGVASTALTITENYTGSTGTQLGLTETQTAANAKLTLDGLAVESASNDVTTALSGVTIHILDKTTAPRTMTISADKDAIQKTAEEFLAAYNKAIELVVKQTTITAKTDRSKSLAGDSSIRNLRQIMSSGINYAVPSLSGSTYSALSQIGIKTNSATGKLTLDKKVFAAAMDKNMAAVAKVFTASDGVMKRIQTKLDPYVRVGGILTNRTDGLNKSIKDIDKRIAALNRRVDSYEAALVKQFTALELTVSQIQSQGDYLASAL